MERRPFCHGPECLKYIDEGGAEGKLFFNRNIFILFSMLNDTYNEMGFLDPSRPLQRTYYMPTLFRLFAVAALAVCSWQFGLRVMGLVWDDLATEEAEVPAARRQAPSGGGGVTRGTPCLPGCPGVFGIPPATNPPTSGSISIKGSDGVSPPVINSGIPLMTVALGDSVSFYFDNQVITTMAPYGYWWNQTFCHPNRSCINRILLEYRT